MARELAGKCLCGGVQYAVADEFAYQLPLLELPADHRFVGSKADWFTIADDLPQHQERNIKST